ncbi:MAG TPA: acyl carrier protein [Mycobacteriales bacterium]|nr:acyl carrier protein [Mycobacteriales bacterium]
MSSEAAAGRAGDAALDAVRAAFAVVLEIDSAGLDASTTFAGLQADSLTLVCVADEVEATLGPAGRLHIDDAALAAMSTLGELASYVTRETVH